MNVTLLPCSGGVSLLTPSKAAPFYVTGAWFTLSPVLDSNHCLWEVCPDLQ